VAGEEAWKSAVTLLEIFEHDVQIGLKGNFL
jgi:hypothetical protein